MPELPYNFVAQPQFSHKLIPVFAGSASDNYQERLAKSHKTAVFIDHKLVHYIRKHVHADDGKDKEHKDDKGPHVYQGGHDHHEAGQEHLQGF